MKNFTRNGSTMHFTIIFFVLFSFANTGIVSTIVSPASTVKGIRPSWDKESDRTKYLVEAVPAGNQAKLACKAFGSPEPIVKWFRKGQLLTNDSQRELGEKYKFFRWSLVLENALPSDSDMYQCEVYNKYGSVTREIRLRVEERMRSRPIIDPHTPKNATVFVGSRVNFECNVLSDLNYAIKWFFTPMIVDHSSMSTSPTQVFSDITPKEYLGIEKIFRPQSNKFVILNATFDHQGIYSCQVGNHLGTATRSAYLTVLLPETTEKPENITPHIDVGDKILIEELVTDNAPMTNDTQLALKICLPVFVIILAAIVYVIYYRIRRKRKSKSNHGSSQNSCDSKKFDGRERCANLPLLLNEYAAEWEKDYKDLTFGKEIGSGIGGVVYQGTLHVRQTGKIFYSAIKVAIKEMNSNRAQSLRMLEEELTMFIKIGPHPNILKLLGYCTRVEPFCIVFEYCANGDLKNYLLNHRRRSTDERYENVGRYERPNTDARPTISERELIDFCLQIAKGMKHMVDKNCIHRDLATRNVLLTKNNVVKICDFGMAKILSDGYYYRTETNKFLPVLWMAPEVLATDCFTFQNDIWAFGVCMWEIFSFGAKPYLTELGSHDWNVRAFLMQGRRLRRPDGCREDVYRLMSRCWAHEPIQRPSFIEIVEILSVIKATVMSESYLDLIDGNDTPET